MTLRLPDPAGLEAIIACERPTYRWVPKTKGGRKKEWTTETLWSAAHPIGSDRVRHDEASPTVAIDVPLPADQPATIADAVGIRWSLYLHTAHERRESEPPPSYAAQFVVPVFARD